jgi:hypothetical protein
MTETRTRTETERREALAAFTVRELRDELVERYQAEPETAREAAGLARFNERVEQATARLAAG